MTDSKLRAAAQAVLAGRDLGVTDPYAWRALRESLAAPEEPRSHFSWSFLRQAVARGADVLGGYGTSRSESYEHYSAKLDEIARELDDSQAPEEPCQECERWEQVWVALNDMGANLGNANKPLAVTASWALLNGEREKLQADLVESYKSLAVECAKTDRLQAEVERLTAVAMEPCQKCAFYASVASAYKAERDLAWAALHKIASDEHSLLDENSNVDIARAALEGK